MNMHADITSYSLENSKHITTGDGGIVVTSNEEYDQDEKVWISELWSYESRRWKDKA